jgi:hypothetical protein
MENFQCKFNPFRAIEEKRKYTLFLLYPERVKQIIDISSFGRREDTYGVWSRIGGWHLLEHMTYINIHTKLKRIK